MKSTGLKIIASVLVLAGIALGVVGYRDATMSEPVEILDPEGGATTDAALERVVVTTRAIEAGEKLTPDNLTVGSRNLSDLQSMGSFYTIPTELFDRRALVQLSAGEVITASVLKKKPESTPLGKTLRSGFQALAISVDEVEGAGGFLVPGDRVDLIWSIHEPGGKKPYARRLVSNVRVLAFGDQIMARANQSPEPMSSALPLEGLDSEEQSGSDSAALREDRPEAEKQARARSAVLEIEDRVVTEVVLAARSGRIRLSVVSQAGQGGLLQPEGEGSTRSDAQQADRATGTHDATEPEQGVTLDDLVDRREPPSPALPAPQQRAPKPRESVTVFSGSDSSTVSVSK